MVLEMNTSPGVFISGIRHLNTLPHILVLLVVVVPLYPAADIVLIIFPLIFEDTVI